ncbi:tetratricopeptide repeat protein [Actomonas aquatica]|uniref:Peptidase MA family metallohydrolase n=1 Tax=Actomonas aquatica TaxID=2866162 RepID=A0ABZ1C8P6_9BACT|nr:tetratricopeptide repeat protein [Opitutus sp. WL0086]WRQ88000.1 peptidase MA family metallohydrolase [Opitutus sp. WL0086]
MVPSSVYSTVPLMTAGHIALPAAFLRWSHLKILGVAAAILASAISATAQSAPDLDRAWDAFITGSYEEAIKLAQAGRAADEENEDWWRIEADSLLTLGRYREAYDLLGLGVVVNSDSLWLMMLRRDAERFIATAGPQEPLSQNDLVRSINMAAAYRGSNALEDSGFLAAIAHSALAAGVEPKFVLDRFLKPAQEKPAPAREAFIVAGRLALDKQDPALASRTFRAGLEHYPEDPDLLLGLAEAFRPSNTQAFISHLYRALARNARHIGAHLQLADHHIDAEDYAAAANAIEQVLEVNPRQPDALAYRAAISYLRDENDLAAIQRELALALWPTNPRPDYLIGEKLSRQYRFAEGAAAQRRALALDPTYQPARLQLAQDLLRLGHEDEGWAIAELVHANDGYNIEAYNLTSLRDRVAAFTTVESPHFRIRMSPEEAPIYGQRALALLESARVDLSERYGIQLEQITTVEIYPDPADFAVRTFGMPGVGGYLGVCFGPVFTVNSPAASRANWEAVLWHEFAHVITLTLTKNRMPRWLSEGISVYEELRRDPAWGQRMSVDYYNRIVNGRIQPISDMSAAFVEARTSDDTLFAYYQSYLVVEFLVERYGFEPLRGMLADLAGGQPINDALAAWFDPLPDLETGFVAFAEERAAALAPDYDLDLPQPPAEPDPAEEGNLLTQFLRPVDLSSLPLPFGDDNLPQLLDSLRPAVEAGDWEKIRDELAPIAATGLYLPEPFNVHTLLARAYRELGDTAAERATLEAIVANQAEALSAITRLLSLATAADDTAAMARWSDAWIAVNPLATTPWRARFEAHRALGESGTAITAAQTLLRLDPPDRAALHYNLAELFQAEGDPASARRHVLLALAEAPRYRDAYRLLARLPATASATP